MSTTQFGTVASVLKVALAFVNAFAGILAAYPGPELSPLARVLAAAVVGGCGAALLLLNPPGGVSDTTIKRMVTEAEGRMKRASADPLPPTPRYPRSDVPRVTEANQP